MELYEKNGNILYILNVLKKFSDEEKYFVCRSYMDAPDVDPKMLIKINKDSISRVVVGEWTTVEITGIKKYDYICKVVKGE